MGLPSPRFQTLQQVNFPANSDRVTRPQPAYRRLDFSTSRSPRLTHYLFRYPAKFHPPVVHSLIQAYTTVGQTILDPFCGSGTLLLAAAVEGRSAIGTDIDPLAVFVAKVKSHRYRPGHLRRSWSLLSQDLHSVARSAAEYDRRRFADVALADYHAVIGDESLWVPDIPNLLHWFRRYVIVDLARIIKAISSIDVPETHRSFFRLIFASIIRKSSNADPVPVSGLEVTSYMRSLDAAGRLVNPFQLFSEAANKGLTDVSAFSEACDPRSRVSVFQADATSLGPQLKMPIEAVITSPPYHTAVDYYRRHQLEMFWLGLTKSQSDRLALLPQYIGRPRVRKRDPRLRRLDELDSLSRCWQERIEAISPERANAFTHYMLSMKDVLLRMSEILPASAPTIVVIGNSTLNGATLPITDLLAEAASRHFELEETLSYPIKNRYMSYNRRNGANIDEECVMVFRNRRCD